MNIGALVLQGLESNDQMGWVFVDSRAEALDGVAERFLCCKTACLIIL